MENIPIPENVKQYITALQDYYERKTEYEESYKSKKKDILKQKELSYKKMSSKIQKIDRFCVQCGRKGGTIFSQENRNLIARCGCEEPCELNISLKLSLTIDLYKEIDKLEKEFSVIEEDLEGTLEMYSKNKEIIQKLKDNLENPGSKEGKEKAFDYDEHDKTTKRTTNDQINA